MLFLIGCIELVLMPAFATSSDLLLRIADLSEVRMQSFSVTHNFFQSLIISDPDVQYCPTNFKRREENLMLTLNWDKSAWTKDYLISNLPHL